MKPSEISVKEILNDGKSKSSFIKFIFLFLMIFISRIPFIGFGYGSDHDAWRLAVAARNISINSAYEISRFPGHPFQELFCSLFWKGGPFVLNGFTVLLSTVGILYFTLILKMLGFKNYLLTGIAFAFVPLVYINCTNSMDFLWALSFMLAALYYILKGNIIASGILMGIAIGCRITSGLMLIPLIILLAGMNDSRHIKGNIVKLILPTLAAGGVLFIPVILKYGSGFFTFDESGYPSAMILIKRLTVNIWGILGSICLIFVLMVQFFYRKPNGKFFTTVISSKMILVYSSVSAVLLYLIVFFRLPHESGYLLPALPFIFILLSLYMNRRLYNYFCCGILLSAFIFSVSLFDPELNSTNSPVSFKTDLGEYKAVIDFLYGPIIIDMQVRKAVLNYVEKTLRRGALINEKSVVAAGIRLPFIDGTHGSRFQGKVEYVALFTPDEYRYYYDNGYNFLYMPGEDEAELRYYGIDIRDAGAKSFFMCK